MTKINRPSYALGVSISALLIAAPAYAGGVPAGTLIDNTATATYSDGTNTSTLDSNTVTIKVDEVIDVAVASQDAGDIPVNSTAVLSFSVTNTGNGPEAFTFTADPEIAGNDFDMTIDSLAIDTDGNGIYEAGVDELIANGSVSDLIDPDTPITVFVLVTAPEGISNGQQSKVGLLAEAITGTGPAGTVFVGAGEDGGDAVVGSSTASDTAPGSLIAALAILTLDKSAVIADPFGGNQPVPGAIITYSIVASVNGSGSLSEVIINDAVPAQTTYQTGTLSLDSDDLTDGDDGDAGQATTSEIEVELGTIDAGTSHTITFDVQIDEE